MIWCGLGRPVIAQTIGNWPVFVLLGWRFVFGISIKWDGREPHVLRCHRGSGGITKAVSLLRLLEDQQKCVTPRTSLIARPARGYSVSLPCHLTNGVDRPWVVGREFESHVLHENAFWTKWISSCHESEKYFWISRNWNHVLVTRWPVYPVRSRGGECYKA